MRGWRGTELSKAAFLLLLMVGSSNALQGQTESITVRGLALDSRGMRDSLGIPFWNALAATSCRRLSTGSDSARVSGERATPAAVRDALRETVRPIKGRAGVVVRRSTVFRGIGYTVDRVRILARIPGEESAAYVAHPVGMHDRSPAILLLHGSGMHPEEAFGWSSTYQRGERANNAAFIGLASELARAGYTVIVPLLGDDAASGFWQLFHWSGLERNGISLRARVSALGPWHLVFNELEGAVDYLTSLPEVDTAKVGVIGWAEGSIAAGFLAALDPRLRAIVRLAPPVKRDSLRVTRVGLFDGAHFTHVDCALGDESVAPLLAPRPLLYAYSTKDESVSRIMSFFSPDVVSRIRRSYTAARRPGNLGILADTTWSAMNRRQVRLWLDAIFHAPSRAVPMELALGQVVTPPDESGWANAGKLARERYVASLGTCLRTSPAPDYTSTQAFLSSVAPFRDRVARSLGLRVQDADESAVVTERTTVSAQPGYTLQFIQFRSSRTSIPIAGLLAIPRRAAPKRMPAVVSADGDAGLGAPFGLPKREQTPYLNAYADALASNGTVVFVPYYPFEFPEIAAAEANARGTSATSLSYLIPIFSAAADFLRAMPGVDSTRVGIWGISFAGVAALYTAAMDARFSAVVFSDPVVSAQVLFSTQTSASLVSWWPEVCSTIDAVQAYLIAPRMFVRENGLRDANGYESAPLESVRAIQQTYESLKVGERFEFVRHTGGHETRPGEVRRALH